MIIYALTIEEDERNKFIAVIRVQFPTVASTNANHGHNETRDRT